LEKLSVDEATKPEEKISQLDGGLVLKVRELERYKIDAEEHSAKIESLLEDNYKSQLRKVQTRKIKIERESKVYRQIIIEKASY
jgi:predicted transposase YdaD